MTRYFHIGYRILMVLSGMVIMIVPGFAQSLTGEIHVAAPSNTGTASNTPAYAPQAKPAETIRQYLDNHREQYRLALQKAKTWVDNLTVDPFDLRIHNIKGKKKLAECLDFYVRLHGIAAPDAKGPLLDNMKKRVAITYESRYHDMAGISDIQFKEDATSYLRVAFLMDRTGLNTTMYQDEIRKILPRLNAHMITRGTDQRMAFHLYYQHFKLAEPFPLATAFKAGVIASRHDPAWFKNRMEVYNLTHEIFVPYQFGEKLDAQFFSDNDKAYLRQILNYLAEYYIGINDPDVVGELSSCMSYLKFTDLAQYRTALTYLLDCQLTDGKWGYYEHCRPVYGDFVNQGFYLHTTLVAVDALTTAFQIMTVDEH